LGAKVEDSKDHKLDSLILGERKKRYIFRLDKMLLSYFSNKQLINKISLSGGNFLFLTSRKEYYETIRLNADACSQGAML
jgi:ribosomal protein S2